MTALLVVLMFVAFVAIDFLVREVAHRMKEKRARHEREEVLNVAVRLDFTAEAKSLKRIEVPNPKARILAVDDESVVLDSFRRILVLEGFNVDTVESGPEALGLIQRHDYDFVFTDLKMPEMDGVEVVKAVKHLRPDLDVVVITGYGTIETAVETLQHGACEYVQKPFTAEELAEFVRKLLIKRQARVEAQQRPTVRIVAPIAAETAPSNEYCVPGGAFVAPGHTWARIEPGGQVRIGIDDFARKALGSVSQVLLPEHGREVHQGQTLFTLKQGAEQVQFVAPVSGKVLQGNDALESDPDRVIQSPYDRGWILRVQPTDLAAELPAMRIGKPVVEWYQDEIARLRDVKKEMSPTRESLDLNTFEKAFLKP
jgi:CheY-like chemotaxis protein/glycine cleavage system H lipoate-binding protein